METNEAEIARPTNDYMLSLVLRNEGYAMAFPNELLAEGLAPEGLKEYIVQRSRWCIDPMKVLCGRMGLFSSSNLWWLERDRDHLLTPDTNLPAVAAEVPCRRIAGTG